MPLTLEGNIQTERLRLRRLAQADLPALMPYYTDPVYLQYLPNPPWKGLADGDIWYARMQERQKDGAALQLVIEDLAGTIVGICLLFNLDEAGRRVELGYALGPAYWGRGYAREAVGGLLKYAFEAQDLRRIDATIDPRNTASRKVLDYFGFQHEGTIRERTVMQGQIVDSAIFGLLKREWRESSGVSL
jgi:RimJ/RimL family protein N-acetyltransferase